MICKSHKNFVSCHDTIISRHNTVVSRHDTTISRHATVLYIMILTIRMRILRLIHSSLSSKRRFIPVYKAVLYKNIFFAKGVLTDCKQNSYI